MLYHREVFWKEEFDQQSHEIVMGNLIATRHLMKHLEERRGRSHFLNATLLSNAIDNIRVYNVKPFEVEVENGKVVKAVVRTSYNKHQDVSIVFREGKVITAWLNSNKDHHTSSKHEHYCTE